MSTSSVYPHITAWTTGEEPLVDGSRVPVRRLWDWHRRGIPCETLFKRYPSLGPAKILTALAFAYDNQDLMKFFEDADAAGALCHGDR